MQGVSRQEKAPYILIVDDDDDDVFLMKRALARVGCGGVAPIACGRVENGYEALSLLSRTDMDELPSALILDINMPELDGLGVLKELRRSPGLSALPVFVLSTTANEAAHFAAMGFGATRIYVKPNTMGELTNIVREILDAVNGVAMSPGQVASDRTPVPVSPL
jgi:two-component system, chemotaxis family, chemotaxis protein CheY